MTNKTVNDITFVEGKCIIILIGQQNKRVTMVHNYPAFMLCKYGNYIIGVPKTTIVIDDAPPMIQE